MTVRTDFGPSGRMRERIELGEPVDVFTSADTGHPAKLVADGKAQVMAMFAVKAPMEAQGQNLPPSAGLQFFGHVQVNGTTRQMTVTLRDVADHVGDDDRPGEQSLSLATGHRSFTSRAG